ncbi:hypothetical protein [Actinomycetospora termitidis]|uniref:Uncharacterized protein n=1 Tax=Actinomycetospora termitidis TaxID=3053470 RepID=A0ABT7MFC3_9PSEU|nr:hypothetical protein [Actinomycetospora sp. Odt1-22]MDL5158068.1 hypothetical protein [Actinomycetospora sp. Odt1-22]
MRELLWSTFLPWVRIPGTPVFRAVPAPADLPGYHPYDAGHELPGATIDDTRSRRVCARILAAEPARTTEIVAVLERLGFEHGADEESWRAIGTWFADRAVDDATPSLALDLGLLLGRRIVDAREGARWDADADSVQAYPQVVLGESATVIALPLQAVESHTDLGDVLTTASEMSEYDPAADFVAHLEQVLDEQDTPLTRDELGWLLSEYDLDDLPELPEDLRIRLSEQLDPPSGTRPE